MEPQAEQQRCEGRVIEQPPEGALPLTALVVTAMAIFFTIIAWWATASAAWGVGAVLLTLYASKGNTPAAELEEAQDGESGKAEDTPLLDGHSTVKQNALAEALEEVYVDCESDSGDDGDDGSEAPKPEGSIPSVPVACNATQQPISQMSWQEDSKLVQEVVAESFSSSAVKVLAKKIFEAEHGKDFVTCVDMPEVWCGSAEKAIKCCYRFPEVSFEDAVWLMGDYTAPPERFPFETQFRQCKVLDTKQHAPGAVTHTLLYHIPIALPFVADRQSLVKTHCITLEDVFVSLTESTSWHPKCMSTPKDMVRMVTKFELMGIRRWGEGTEMITITDVDYGGSIPKAFIESLEVKVPPEFHKAVNGCNPKGRRSE